LKDLEPTYSGEEMALAEDRITHSHLRRRMMARVASTALLRVIESKSPKVDPRNRVIWSPHQSKSFSKGMIERKHTGQDSNGQQHA